MMGRRRRERIVQVTPCTGWVARYPVDSVDKLGRKTRAVAAWAVLEEAGGGWRVVGLTSDYERTADYLTNGSKLARPPAARLVRCDELPGFVGYDEAGRW
jgi:hypothetical protein